MKARVTYLAGLNVREKKSKNSDVVRVMKFGEEFEFEGMDADWLKLSDGWCMAEFAYVIVDSGSGGSGGSDELIVTVEEVYPEEGAPEKSIDTPYEEIVAALTEGKKVRVKYFMRGDGWEEFHGCYEYVGDNAYLDAHLFFARMNAEPGMSAVYLPHARIRSITIYSDGTFEAVNTVELDQIIFSSYGLLIRGADDKVYNICVNENGELVAELSFVYNEENPV